MIWFNSAMDRAVSDRLPKAFRVGKNSGPLPCRRVSTVSRLLQDRVSSILRRPTTKSLADLRRVCSIFHHEENAQWRFLTLARVGAFHIVTFVPIRLPLVTLKSLLLPKDR